MNREHLTSEQVWLLLAVWDTRSLTLAARALGVSTATATRLMTSVRLLLRDPLYLRGGEGLVPTARMSALEPKLRELQYGLIDVARTPERFDPAEIHTTIRMAGVDNAAFAFLLPCLRDLYKAAPNLRLSFVPLTDDFTRRLEAGLVDLVFYAPPMKLEPDFHELPLFCANHAPVVRKGHPILKRVKALEAQGEPFTSAELAPYREITLTYGSLEGHAAEHMGPLGEDHVAMDCAYFLASAFFLLETDFYARLPRFTAQYLAQRLPLAILPEISDITDPVWQARMIWHGRTDRDPALQWFRSVISGKRRSDAVA